MNRYAHRLLKLKVKFAEISIVVRPAPKVDPGVYRYIVIEKFREITQNLLIIFTFDKQTRICISNEAGYLLKIHIYKVEEAPDTGILKFFSYTDAEYGFFEHGPMHCLPVSTPYITKVCKI